MLFTIPFYKFNNHYRTFQLLTRFSIRGRRVVVPLFWKLDYFGVRWREFETIPILPDKLSRRLFSGFEPAQPFRGFSKKHSKQRIRFEYDLIPCFRQGFAYAVFADFALEYPLGRFEGFLGFYIGLGK